MSFFNLFKKKFTFKKNNKVDILLLDENYSDLTFEKKKVASVNFNEINIYYIFLAIIYFFFKRKKKNISFNKIYWKLLMGDFDPKVAIGIDINLRIFTFKDMFHDKKAIAYQYGHYWDIHVERSRNHMSGKKCDYFFIFSEWDKKIFDVIETEFIVSGSVKNNEKFLKKKEEKKYDLMFISEFRKLDKNVINEVKKGYDSYTFANKSIFMTFKDVCSIYVLNILNKYCESKNKK